MFRFIDWTKIGGYPLSQKDMDWLQSSYRGAFSALAGLIGDGVIITGMVEAGGEVTAGWIAINNELVPFQSGAIGSGEFIIEETGSALVFKDGASKTVKFERIARFSAGGPYQYADLVRINLKNLSAALVALTADYNAHTHAWADITGKPAGYITYVGSYSFGDVAASEQKKTVAIPNQGGTNYIVAGSLRGIGANWNDENDVSWIVYNRQAASFDLAIREYAGVTQNLVFDYAIIKSL